MLDGLALSVLHADFDHFWIWTAILAASVIWCLYATFRSLRHTRLIEDTPTSRVRSAPQGYVELEGMGRLHQTQVVCPLTGAPCLWFSFKVEEERGSGKNRRWVTIEKDISWEPFVLEDATGRCIVYPAGAEVVPGMKHTWYGSTARPSRLPGSNPWWRRIGSGRYRYTEQLLVRDLPIYALGQFSTHSDDAAPGTDASVREKLAAWKQDPARMKLFDVNHDGVVDIKEWEAARRVAAAEVQREFLARPPGPAVDVLTKPPIEEQPFILSAVLQKELCRRYRWQSAGSFLWFVTGGAALVWLLIARGVL